MTARHPRDSKLKRTLLGVTVAAGLLLIPVMSCRTGAPPPSLQPSGPALDATGSKAAAVDGSAVDRLLALFRTFEPGSLDAAARSVYAADVYFNDGFVELHGVDALAEYLVRSAGHVSELHIEAQDVVVHGSEVYLRWEMTYTTGSDRTIVAPGISHLRFDTDGQILYHRDYWDASGALAMHVAPAAAILRTIRNRL